MTYLEILTAVATIVVPMFSIQTFWIARGFSTLERRIDGVERSLGQRLDRVEERLDHIDRTVIHDHAEPIARLESRS